MPREVRTQLRDLIDTLRCNWHSTMDITLTSGVPLFFSTGEIHVNRFGKNQQYLARLSGLESLEMSLSEEVDGQAFKVGDVDNVVGQTLTGATRNLDGAEAISGVLFIDPSLPLSDAIWDAKMPGELMNGEVGDADVSFSLVSLIDSVIVSGRTISSEFQWQESLANDRSTDPNDTQPSHPSSPSITERKFRYSEYDPSFS